MNETANVGADCWCENRGSHGPSFAILPHGLYLGAVVYPVWETDDPVRPAQLHPPYHATKLCHPAYLVAHLELWAPGEEGQCFEGSLEST